MKFNIEEIDTMKELFQIGDTSAENISNLLHEDVYNFLKDEKRINTIVDRLIYRQANNAKPFDVIILTKFLKKDFNIIQALQKLLENLTGRYCIYIDFHFLFLTTPKDDDEAETFKFQGGSKASAMNATIKITDEEDIKDLMSEFKNQEDVDLLNSAFEHHSEMFEYQNSGLHPYQLLSLLIHIQKMP